MATFQELPSTTDDILLDNLSTADIFRFGRTSKSARHILQSYVNRRYKLAHTLSRFFTEDQTEDLRTLMSSTGMIISGSIALQFLDRRRTLYPDSDLDLYVPFKYARHVANWLISTGYTYTPKTESLSSVSIALHDAVIRLGNNHTGITPSTNRGYLSATCVLDFTATDPPRKVQLISTLRSTIELILGFHSTCVMNVITHDKAYCLFPRGTLEERRALTYLNPSSTRAAHRIAYRKYVERGWELVESITRDEFDDPYSSFARGTRFVGDSKSWTLPILPLREDLPESNITINSFTLEYDEDLQSVFSFKHLDFEGLQQPYVLREEDVRYVMEHLVLPRVPRAYWSIHDLEDETDVDSNEGREEESTDEEDEDSNEDYLETGNQITFDQTLKSLMVEMRELDIIHM